MFNTINQNIVDWLKSSSFDLKFFGLSPEQYSTIQFFHLNHKESPLYDTNHIFVFPSVDEAEESYAFLKTHLNNHACLFFPGLETSPYSGFLSSERNLYDRFYVLQQITQNPKKVIVFTTAEALCLKIPGPEFFLDNQKLLEVSDIISPLELAKSLNEIGYVHSTTVEEPGQFSQKGEIFDIFPTNGKAIRLNYFDDMIETIFSIDTESGKTNRNETFEKVIIGPAPAVLTKDEYALNLRENIPMPAPKFKDKYEKRKAIFRQISDGHLFEDYPAYVSLFLKESVSLFDYLNDFQTHFIESFKINQEITEYQEGMRDDYERDLEDYNSEQILPEPHHIYFSELPELTKPKILTDLVHLDYDFEESEGRKVDLKLEKTKSFFNQVVNPTLKKHEFITECLNYLKEQFKSSGKIIFTYNNESSKNELLHLLDITGLQNVLRDRFELIKLNLAHGFFYEPEKTLIISEGDLFSTKKVKTKAHKKQDLDLFAEQLATLKAGDYVIHNEHGVGEYLGLESLDVGGNPTDYLVLLYSGNDKVYVPVYKMNLIQKHADGVANLKPDSLRTNKFSTAKKKARESAKKLAFDLLKLQAERESAQAFAFSEPDHIYKEFELSFPFEETPDQTRAICDVLESMQKPKPMDHLVCGDVGFGKTEVAIRAAFKAVLDHKQVAVLVPTTILALQHYNSFLKRLKHFPVNIEFLSRFKSAKESALIVDKLAKGEVDIVIGTHKLLSDKIKFSDLGLVVVDEEQRFGVGHKEKLKLLKASVDFLTLTATPIPRTLQMTFLGLRELSLIKTAPPKRQSIKSYIIKEDAHTVQSAIRKELNRGGQVFIVHNKVQDIEQFSASIRELVPEAKIVIGHGQLAEKELEQRIRAFYNGDYQILIATTIIESGIDIPNANTMIIDRADRFGLAQLHQLRGRIGRSDKKAYAYFMIPNNRNLSNIAEKRLKALQTYADMGSGFNIASCDLEIRGAGDILGPTQSGHIDNVGLELYMELLQDAIRELKGEKKIFNKNIEFSTPFPAFIPNHYITDSSERLKQYKRLSNSQDLSHLSEMKEELYDIFGAFPQELKNFFTILECRTHLINCGVKAVNLAGSSITLQFEKSLLESNPELGNQVANTFLSKPKVYQFSPDYKVLYNKGSAFTQEELLDFCKEISQQIVPS